MLIAQISQREWWKLSKPNKSKSSQLKNNKHGTDGLVDWETGVFQDSYGGDIEFQLILFQRKVKNKPIHLIKTTGLLLAHTNKHWKRPHKSLVFLRNNSSSNKIMMFLIPGSAQGFSPSLLLNGQTPNIKITRLSSLIKCLKQEKISCSSGSQEWLWCHSGLLIRLLLMKSFSILWFVTVKETKCQNQEETLLILWKLLKELVLTIWSRKSEIVTYQKVNKILQSRNLNTNSHKESVNVVQMLWDSVC